VILLFSGFEENDGLVKEDVGRLSSLRDSLTMGMNGNKRFESGGGSLVPFVPFTIYNETKTWEGLLWLQVPGGTVTQNKNKHREAKNPT